MDVEKFVRSGKFSFGKSFVIGKFFSGESLSGEKICGRGSFVVCELFSVGEVCGVSKFGNNILWAEKFARSKKFSADKVRGEFFPKNYYSTE